MDFKKPVYWRCPECGEAFDFTDERLEDGQVRCECGDILLIGMDNLIVCSTPELTIAEEEAK